MNQGLIIGLRVFASTLIFIVNFCYAQSEVADAAMQGNNKLVHTLLQDNFDVNFEQKDGATALHWAAYHGDVELITALLYAGANPSVANRNGSTPMWLAAKQGDAPVLKALLEGGADANEPLPLGRRPLMLASRSGSAAAVQTLLDFGADVNASEEKRGTTALMQAADHGHADVMAVLINNGADIATGTLPFIRAGRTAALGNSDDPRNSVRRQFLAIICERVIPDLDLLKKIINDSNGDSSLGELNTLGADVTSEDICNKIQLSGLGFVTIVGGGGGVGDGGDGGFEEGAREPDGGELTALVYAARSGVIEAAQVLLDAGAEVNQLTRYGWSPLLAATQNRHYLMGKFLIENGADVNIANKGGWTNLYLATDNRNVEGGDYPTREPDMDHLDYILFLLDNGANPNDRLSESTETRTVFTNQWLNEEGATAFLRASQSGDVPLMQLLLEYNADPFINTDLGVTPLSVAAGIGWVEGVTSEWTTSQTIEAIKMLLTLGIDPNFQADTGRTALHGAAHKGSTEVARILIEAGAWMDIRDFGNTDNRGSTDLVSHTWQPIDYADGLVRVGVQSSIAHPETAELLRKLMIEAGLETPEVGRTLESICIVDVCTPGYDPIEYN